MYNKIMQQIIDYLSVVNVIYNDIVVRGKSEN